MRTLFMTAGLAAALLSFDPGVAVGAPLPAGLSVAPLATPVARCAPGLRRHTITGKCVRPRPRIPGLGWF
jgi:hypothetical protein